MDRIQILHCRPSRARDLTAFLRIGAVILAGCALTSPRRSLADTFPNLGGAGNYAVLGVGGTIVVSSDFEVYQSATVVTGNVGLGPYSNWTHGIDATITGRLDYDTTDTLPAITGTIGGGTHQMPMSSIVADALAASTTASLLTPTQTFSTLTEDQIIVGNGGLNVIDITGDVTLKKTLTLQGTASDQFVFQLTANDATSAKTLTLSGVIMSLVGGVTAGNVLWDLNGTGGQLVITSGATVYGTFLAPDRSITVDHGIITGRVIGGGSPDPNNQNFLSIHSSSQITSPDAVPEPSEVAALSAMSLMGLGGLFHFRRRAKAV